ncbi:MAG: Rieske 2Fe-2S domain-containing protein [Sphingomonadales bacterium]|nr:Rieske 2Fe-2S domain-containing protein [Sphingomonadales bacterium]
MTFVRVAGVGDVAPGKMIPVEAQGRKLLLANVDGAYRAASRKCPHFGFNLCKGTLDGDAVVCPMHKAKFDLSTGEVRRDPKLLFLSMTAKSDLALYPVKVEGADILVGIAD